MSDPLFEQREALPLTGNTGATNATWHIDWLAFSAYLNDTCQAADVARIVGEAMYGLEHAPALAKWTVQGGARFYSERRELLDVSMMSRPTNGARDHVHVVFSGEACGRFSTESLLQMLARLDMRAELHVGRLDLAVDGWAFSPADVRDAIRSDHVVTMVKRGSDGHVTHSWHESNAEGETGTTCNVGSRASERYLRVYDYRGFTRYELEFKDGQADTLAVALVAMRDDHSALAARVVTSLREFADWGEPDDDADHGYRRRNAVDHLLPWWREAVESLPRLAKLAVGRTEPTVDRKVAWIERSVVKSMAVVTRAYGWDVLDIIAGWVRDADKRLTGRDLAAIRDFDYHYKTHRERDRLRFRLRVMRVERARKNSVGKRLTFTRV